MAATSDEVMARSPADVLRLVVAVVSLLLLLLIAWLFGQTLDGFASDLLRGLDALPDWIVTVTIVATRLLVISFVLVGVVVTLLRNGWRALLTMGLASVVALAIALLLDDVPHIDTGAVPLHVPSGLGPLTDGAFPAAGGIAVVAALVTAGAPWLSRSWRRAGWMTVFGLVFTRFISTPTSFDSLKAALIGWGAGAAALVVLGAPSRRPTADAIRAGLAAVGLPLETLAPASVDARGSTPYFGADCNGQRYFVKSLGTDQRSADLLFRLYRSLQRHDLGDERPFSSLRRAVEHEALVALAARDLDVPTPRMRALAVAEPSAFVLAYEAVDGRSLDGVPLEEMTDDVLADAWTQLARLRSVRIAHRDLRLANLFLASDGRIWMIDFGFSELAASDLLLANDVAELVASSGAVVGAERATAHARATVDPATLAAARERLNVWSLSGATRTALKQQPGLLDQLRTGLATTT